MTMSFKDKPEFQKELKRLSKKYRSLPEDLRGFCQIISTIPLGNSKHFNVLVRTESCCIVKARLFCRYLKGASLRIVYSYSEQDCLVEFIELYFKGDKENEDGKRIKKYLKEREA